MVLPDDAVEPCLEPCRFGAEFLQQLGLEGIGDLFQPVHQGSPRVGERQRHEPAVVGVRQLGDEPGFLEPRRLPG